MKAALIVLIVVIVALGVKLRADLELNARQQAELTDLTAKLNDKTKSELLERRKACSIQADKVLRQLGYDLAKDLVTAENHFNPKLDKCFLSVTSSISGKRTLTRNRFLVDAYEQRGYGEFRDNFALGEKMAPFCALTPPAESAPPCTSEDDYQAFVARYME